MAEALEYPVGGMTLLTRCGLVVYEPTANLVSILVRLATPDLFGGVRFAEVLLVYDLFNGLTVVAGFP